MKYVSRMVLVVAVVSLFAMPAKADVHGHKFGLGLYLGTPVGMNAQFFLSPNNAVDTTLGFGFLNGNSFHIDADYMYHFELVKNSDLELKFFVGVGPTLEIHPKSVLMVSANIPFGLTFVIQNLSKYPFDIFIEARPGLMMVPGIWYDIEGAIGIRYYF